MEYDGFVGTCFVVQNSVWHDGISFGGFDHQATWGYRAPSGRKWRWWNAGNVDVLCPCYFRRHMLNVKKSS